MKQRKIYNGAITGDIRRKKNNYEKKLQKKRKSKKKECALFKCAFTKCVPFFFDNFM